MKKIEKVISLQEFESAHELSEKDRELIAAARAASAHAYAPYSGFEVGASVMLDDGMILSANNQESMAFPSGLCAERVLLFSVLSEFPDKKIKAMAITCKSQHDSVKTPQTPCGACRQILSETELRQEQAFRVILQGESGPVWMLESASLLMPWPFKLEQ